MTFTPPRPALRQVILLGGFALAACLMLYWPLFHASTHIPGNFATDYFHGHWNYWWIRHALTTPGAQLYETNYVLFPYTANLAYHTLAAFWYPLWALLEPLAGTLVAMSAINVVGMTLAGYCTFLLLRQERAPAGLALLGGLAYEISPALLNAVWWTTPNLLGWFWLPLHLLLWGRVARAAQLRAMLAWAVLFGLALAGAVLTDLQTLFFSAFLTVPYGLLTLFKAGQRSGATPQSPSTGRSPLQLIAAGILALGLALILLWGIGLIPHLLAFDRSALAVGPPDATLAVHFPAGYLSRVDAYWGTLSTGTFLPLATVGALVLSLSGSGRRSLHDRRRWFWLALAVVPLLLSAGDHLILGGSEVLMPYHALHGLLGGVFRVPSRFVPVFALPLLVFAGRTWGAVLARRPRPPLARLLLASALLMLLFADLRLYEPMPVQEPVRQYAFYAAMGQERGDPYDDYVVLEVPVAAGSGEQWIGPLNQLATQFNGITHGKRMVNGLVSRVPTEAFWYLRSDDPLLSWLGGRRWLEPDAVEAELRDHITAWPIGYVVVHQELLDRQSATPQEIIGYFNQQPDLLCPFAVEGEAVAYRTAWHPDGCPPRTPPETVPGVYTVDVGSLGDERFIGWGWHWPEGVFDVTLRWIGDQRWTADDPRADLYVDLPPGDYAVTVAAQAFWEARDVTLRINGAVVGTAAVPLELSELTFAVPAALISDGEHVQVTLAYDTWTVPVEVGQSADERLLSLAVDRVVFARQG